MFVVVVATALIYVVVVGVVVVVFISLFNSLFVFQLLFLLLFDLHLKRKILLLTLHPQFKRCEII